MEPYNTSKDHIGQYNALPMVSIIHAVHGPRFSACQDLISVAAAIKWAKNSKRTPPTGWSLCSAQPCSPMLYCIRHLNLMLGYLKCVKLIMMRHKTYAGARVRAPPCAIWFLESELMETPGTLNLWGESAKKCYWIKFLNNVFFCFSFCFLKNHLFS